MSQSVFSAEILALISSVLGCEGLEISLSPHWGSQTNPNHRLEIRKAIAQRLNAPSAVWANDLLQLPSAEEFVISISHGFNWGGYALCKIPSSTRPSDMGIGFDIEKSSRLSSAIIQRVSSQEELSGALEPRLIWGAKEAAFKSLRDSGQPGAITEISTHSWVDLGSEAGARLYSFCASVPDQGPNRIGCGVAIFGFDPAEDEIFTVFLRNRAHRLT